jgi:hypothetical protein
MSASQNLLRLRNLLVFEQCDGRSLYTEFGIRDFFCGIRDIVLDIEKYEFLVLGIISLIPKTFSCYYQAFTFELELIEINFLQENESITIKCTTTLTSVFPCVLNGAYDHLQCLVFIPTSVQTTLSGSNHSLGLNDSIETVKDYQSFQLRSHLTKRSLETMVEYAVSHFNLGATGGQNFFVSDTLIEELLSLDTFLQEEPNSSVSINGRIPKSLVE